jgi:predicted nucleic acid-binding protein
LANLADVSHDLATQAVVELHRRGEVLHITPQVLIEFRSVATRPTNLNGLGLSNADVITQSATFEVAFPVLAETPEIYTKWKAIVEGLGIVGKQVHDARLVAVCQVHHLTHLLTFNVAHFTRFAKTGSGITVISQENV